jgi:hypothetical protein
MKEFWTFLGFLKALNYARPYDNIVLPLRSLVHCEETDKHHYKINDQYSYIEVMSNMLLEWKKVVIKFAWIKHRKLYKGNDFLWVWVCMCVCVYARVYVITGLEFRASCLLGRYSTTWTIPPALYSSFPGLGFQLRASCLLGKPSTAWAMPSAKI